LSHYYYYFIIIINCLWVERRVASVVNTAGTVRHKEWSVTRLTITDELVVNR